MRRRGFTLVEMLVALLILIILAGIVFGAYSFVDTATRRQLTEGRVQALGIKATESLGIGGRPPAALMDLAPALGSPAWMRGGQCLDGWERPIRYSTRGTSFRIWSAGSDGIEGTADDIEFSR